MPDSSFEFIEILLQLRIKSKKFDSNARKLHNYEILELEKSDKVCKKKKFKTKFIFSSFKRL
jgi:hypothetical protein